MLPTTEYTYVYDRRRYAYLLYSSGYTFAVMMTLYLTCIDMKLVNPKQVAVRDREKKTVI